MQMTGQSPYISTYVAMSYFIGICKSQRERDFIVRENNRRQLRIEGKVRTIRGKEARQGKPSGEKGRDSLPPPPTRPITCH